MSLVNQFKITLRDFLPDPSDGMVIIDRARFTSTTVSNRLYAELRAYADANKLPLGDVVAQLSEEIQRKPGAIKFAKGNRVKLTWIGYSADATHGRRSQRHNCFYPARRRMGRRVLGRYTASAVYRSRSVGSIR